MDSIRRAATSGAIFSLLSIVAMRALGFLTSLLLARILGPHGLGSYSILLGFNAVGILLAGLGVTIIAPKLVAESALPNGVPREEAPGIISSLITVTACLGLFAGATIALASPLLSHLMFGTAERWPMIAMVGASVTAMAGSAAVGAFLQGLHQIRRLALLNTGVSALYLLLSVPACRFFGVTGAFAAMALSHVGLTLGAIGSLPRAERRPSPWNRMTRDILARGIRLGWPLLVSSLALAVVGWLLRAWLGRTSSLAEVGRYQVAETLNQAILFVPLALAVPLFPLASTMSGATPEERARAFGPVFGYVALFTLPVSLIVGWGARLWVELFGPEYQSAWPIVYLLSAGYFLSSLGTITGALLAGFGLTLDSMKLTVVWAVLFLLPGLVLASRFGAEGVAVAQVLSYVIQTVILAVYFRRRLGIRLLAAPRLLVVFVALFVGGLLLLPHVEPVVGLLLVLPATALVLLAAGDLTRRALAHVTGWISGRQ
jgi:O-antigen/teichoic acid export membrane protein